MAGVEGNLQIAVDVVFIRQSAAADANRICHSKDSAEPGKATFRLKSMSYFSGNLKTANSEDSTELGMRACRALSQYVTKCR